ncbi:1-acyl-sn-glycerol-3-phosphate acyltransferase [Acholeplasma sp. OttesenSCG-928-E16]|nr:1-acyl-sn-glycerol-3-phosphate acyltransferase [Acholeplasma sp. OttesenSCG-928-E16]
MDNEHDFKTIKEKPVTLKKGYKFFNRNPFFLMLSYFVKFLVWLFFYLPVGKLYHKIKVINKKNFKRLKKKGAIVVCNHIHQLDAFYNGCNMLPSNVYFTMLQSNLGIPFAGKIFRIAGGVPIPVDRALLHDFKNDFKGVLDKGKKVLVYPEAALKPYCTRVRQFQNGAFRWAIDFDVPIIPIVITFRLRKGKKERKPYLTFTFLEAEYKKDFETKFEMVENLKNRVHNKMEVHFNKYNELKGENDESSDQRTLL